MTNDLLPCREAFEKWLTADGNYPHLKHKNFGGGYLNDEAAMKWDGWKTAWNTLTKPAEVDLDAAIQLVRSGFIVRENIGDLQFDKYAKALELIISLATGKGGDDKVTVEVSKLLDIRNALCRDDFFEAYHHLYTLVEWQDPYNAWAEWEKVAPEKKLTPQPAATQPAAPTQIDAGELEKAIKYFANDGHEQETPYAITWDEKMAIVLRAARAHLEKSKGGV